MQREAWLETTGLAMRAALLSMVRMVRVVAAAVVVVEPLWELSIAVRLRTPFGGEAVDRADRVAVEVRVASAAKGVAAPLGSLWSTLTQVIRQGSKATRFQRVSAVQRGTEVLGVTAAAVVRAAEGVMWWRS